MAKWKIDSIKAGIGFNRFRFADIYVDDDGIVTAEESPGKEFIGNNPLSNFNPVIRQATLPPLPFTTFCNYTTFTKNRIFASNDFPFAYNVPELNSAECGYETVIPTPGVPYNPFGNPNYGEYARFDFCDDRGINVNIIFRKKNYEGSVWIIEKGGKSPVEITRKEITDLEPIAPTEAKISLIQQENFEYSVFYTQDERMFQVEVIKAGITEFKGYLMPDISNEKFDWPANERIFRATDGLTHLKQVTYPVPLGGSTAERQSFKDMLCYCLAPLNLNLNISTIVNLYASTNRTGLNDDPMAQNTLSPLRLTNEKGTILTSYQVLEELGKMFRAVLVQDGGEWFLFRRKELIIGTSRRRVYDYRGVFLYAEEYQSPRGIGRVL